MIELTNRQILIDGEPRLVIAGEIHYFRTPPEQWAELVELARQAGCNAIASYIPWLIHELALAPGDDGQVTFDLDGHHDPQNDLGRFIDLVAEAGLWFIARPGPFQMAELRNEGIPYRVYRDHPEIVPIGWDGKPATSATVDYLAPAFLAETRRWYQAVAPVLVPRLHEAGGPVIAVQLDNEVGMLSWVTNTPEFTDHLLGRFRDWLGDRDLAGHYAGVAMADDQAWAQAIRSPQEGWAADLRVDFGRFIRQCHADYFWALRDMFVDLGVVGVPFLVNIHGTEGGGGEPFPIGISQLMKAYSGVPGFTSGSDHYVGELTPNATTDLYVMNAYQAAVHDADQPITSLEFEAGTGDYGAGLEMLYDPATTELKTRLFLAQGNRIINYYLIAGGINRPLEVPEHDGQDRVSFTGERHGTAAPITPEGTPGLAYAGTLRAGRAARAAEQWLATSTEQVDAVSLGFVPDSYATEFCYPGSESMKAVVDDLRAHRGAGQRRSIARSLLLQGCTFDAVDLSSHDPRTVDGRPVLLALACSAHLAAEVQQRIVDHLRRGGNLLMVGPVPQYDLAGRECRLLADALGVEPGAMRREGRGYYPSLVATSWLAPWPEYRSGWLQQLHAPAGEVVMTSVDGEVCGVSVGCGAGRAVLFAAELPSHLDLFAKVLAHLEVQPQVRLTSSVPSVFSTVTVDEGGNRLLHAINISGYAPEVSFTTNQGVLGGEAWRLAPRTGYMFPWGVHVPGGRVLLANAELAEVRPDQLVFRPCAPLVGDQGTVVVLETDRTVSAEGATVEHRDGQVIVRGGDQLVLHLG